MGRQNVQLWLIFVFEKIILFTTVRIFNWICKLNVILRFIYNSLVVFATGEKRIFHPRGFFIKVEITDRNRLQISKKITKDCYLLDSRWSGLFLIICQKSCFHPLGNLTWVPRLEISAIYLSCKVNLSDMYCSQYFTQRFKSRFVKFSGVVFLNLNT